VIDSDRESRKALERPEVIAALVGWWGAGILLSDGKVDRQKVSTIVFSNANERLRLEGLIHPLVRADRATVIQGARDAGKVAVVLDAPLLFEAGSDSICDAVFFVDAPLEQRQERVKMRGWSVEELARRESSQLPLDEKRRRSTHVIVNLGTLEELDAATDQALRQVLKPNDCSGADRPSTP
jgi:dephospho-CoA kinase